MKLIKFTPPSNFAPPEGTADGDTFDIAATVKKEGGKLCLLKVDGIPLPGYEEDAEKGEKANEGAAEAGVAADFASRYQAAMQNPQAPA